MENDVKNTGWHGFCIRHDYLPLRDTRPEERRMKRRFDGWKEVQNLIASRIDLVEFRRAGCIRYNIFEKTLGKEKAVDVYLATDLSKKLTLEILIRGIIRGNQYFMST